MKMNKKNKLIIGGLTAFFAIGASMAITTYTKRAHISKQMEVAIESLDIDEILILDSKWKELTSFRYDNGSDRQLYNPLKNQLLSVLQVTSVGDLDNEDITGIVDFLSNSSQRKTLTYQDIAEISNHLGVPYFIEKSRNYRKLSFDKTILSPLESEMLSYNTSSKDIQLQAFNKLAEELSANIVAPTIQRYSGSILGRIKVNNPYNPNEMGAIVKLGEQMALIIYTPMNNRSVQVIASTGADTNAEYIENLNNITKALQESPQVNSYLKDLAVKDTGKRVVTSTREYRVYSYCTSFNERDCEVYKSANGTTYDNEPEASKKSRALFEVFASLSSKFNS